MSRRHKQEWSEPYRNVLLGPSKRGSTGVGRAAVQKPPLSAGVSQVEGYGEACLVEAHLEIPVHNAQLVQVLDCI